MIVEVETFRLRRGTDEAAARAADAAVQTDFAYQQPGLLRRTVARAGNGEWLVVSFWDSNAAADAAEAAAAIDGGVMGAFRTLVEPSSRARSIYETLD